MKISIAVFFIITSLQIAFSQTESIPSAKNIFSIVEKMPSWKGCESIEREAERSACTYEYVMNYLLEEIKYPAVAKANKKEGQVFIKFIIDENGIITVPEIVRGVSPEIDAEALRVVTAMPAWNPGMEKEQPVAVQYILPISFRLNDNSKNK